jgi:hypothetical protein
MPRVPVRRPVISAATFALPASVALYARESAAQVPPGDFRVHDDEISVSFKGPGYAAGGA